jgi:hypothetical protein
VCGERKGERTIVRYDKDGRISRKIGKRYAIEWALAIESRVK